MSRSDPRDLRAADPGVWVEALAAALGLWSLYALVCVGLDRTFDQTVTWVWLPAILWIAFVLWPRRPPAANELERTGADRSREVESREFEGAGLRLVALAVTVVVTLGWCVGRLPWWAAWCALTLWLALPLLAATRTPTPPPERRRPQRRDRLAILLGVAVAVAVTAFIYRPDADDTLYVALAVEALEHPSDPILAFDPVHGEAGIPLTPTFYRLQTYEILVAVLARLSGLPVPALYYLLLPILSATVSVVAIWVLASWISTRHAATLSLLTILVLVAWGGDPQAIGNFAFVRLFQGKAVFACALVPILVHSTLEHLRSPSLRSVIQLGLGQVGAVALSVSAIPLAPLCVAAVLLCEVFGDRRRMQAALTAALAWLPAVPFALLLIADQRREGLLDVLEQSPIGPLEALGGPLRAACAVLLLAITPTLAALAGWPCAGWLRRYLLAGSLLLLWSPPMVALLEALGLASISWRLGWAFPVAVAVAAGATAAATLALGRTRGRPSRPWVLAAAALSTVFFLAAPWTFVEANGAGRTAPTTKWKTDRWRAAREVIAATEPDDLAIVAQPVSNFVPRLPGKPRMVAARYSSTYLPFAQIEPLSDLKPQGPGAGDPGAREPNELSAWRRFQILNFVSGRPQGRADTLADFEFVDDVIELEPRVILLDPGVDGNDWLRRRLTDLGYRKRTVESWTLWHRSEAPGTAAARLEVESDPFLSGFHDPEGDWRWMGPRATVRLHREPGHERWMLRGYVDLALHDNRPLGVAVELGEEPATRFEIADSGPFQLQGPLPTSRGDGGSEFVEIGFECDRSFTPADRGDGSDRRSLCIVVDAIGLIGGGP